MDNRDEVREFLTTRREQLTPEQAQIQAYGSRRRVKGLRREEVAMLAGMSTDYYTRMERGNLAGVSSGVLQAVARALQLDEAERTHLFNLAGTFKRPHAVGERAARPGRSVVRPGLQRVLDTINAPAYVRNGRMDILAANRLGRALFADVYREGTGFNLARYLFLDPRSRSFYLEWEAIARDTVASLRAEAGRNAFDRGLTDLIGQLSTVSDEFRTLWAAHQVKFHRSSTKTLHHPVVGELELTGEAFELPGDPGLILITYTWEGASSTEQALGFLASWSDQESSGVAGSQPANNH